MALKETIQNRAQELLTQYGAFAAFQMSDNGIEAQCYVTVLPDTTLIAAFGVGENGEMTNQKRLRQPLDPLEVGFGENHTFITNFEKLATEELP